MKKLFTFLLITFSFYIFADCQREVQFIGTVRNLQISGARFTFQLELGRWFEPNVICPLDEEEYLDAVIEMQGYPVIANGDEISGILYFDPKNQIYKID